MRKMCLMPYANNKGADQPAHPVQENCNNQQLFVPHYVNISVFIKLYCISGIPSYILSILFMNFMYKLLIVYERKLKRHNIGYISTNNRNIEKHANVMLVDTYPMFPPFFLYFRCKLGVSFARRYFRNGC